MASKKRRTRSARAAGKAGPPSKKRLPQRDWPRLIGEVALIVLVVIVPLAINRTSRNVVDVKDFALGMGVALALSLWLVAALARGRLCWATSRLNPLVIAFLAWAVVSIAYSSHRFAAVSETARLAAHVGLYLLVMLSVRDLGQVKRIVGAACLAALVISAYAFVQAAGRDPINWDSDAVRVFSFLGNATYLAGYLVLLIPLAVALGWPIRSAEPGGRRLAGLPPTSWFFLAAAVVMLVTLYLTITLSPTIGLGLGTAIAFVLALARGGRQMLRIGLPAAAATLVVFGVLAHLGYQRLPESQQRRVQQVIRLQDPYGKERTLIQRVGLDLYRQRPALGMGYGTYRVHSLERLAPEWYTSLGKSAERMLVPNYAHNEFIEVLAELGLVGGVLFTALLAAAYGIVLRTVFRHPDRQWARLSLAIFVAMTAFLFQNLFGVTFRQTGTVTLFWLSLGLLAVAGAGAAKRGEEGSALALREVSFAPITGVRLLPVGAALLVALLILGWTAAKPVRGNLLVKQAELAAKAGDFKSGARLADEASALNPYSALAHYVAAYSWGSLGDDERAVVSSEKALALLPGNASVYYNLGVSYKRLRRLEEAKQSFQRAIDLMPTAVLHRAAMAEVLLELGRVDEALPHAQEAVRLAPKEPKARLLLADVEARRGNEEAALAALSQAARLARRDAGIWAQVARLAFRLQRPEEAIAACRSWIEHDPASVEAHLILGACSYNLGDYRGAVSAFGRAAALNPQNPDPRLRLAYSYARLGRNAEARVELERIVREHPASQQAETARQMLAGGRRR